MWFLLFLLGSLVDRSLRSSSCNAGNSSIYWLHVTFVAFTLRLYICRAEFDFFYMFVEHREPSPPQTLHLTNEQRIFIHRYHILAKTISPAFHWIFLKQRCSLMPPDAYQPSPSTSASLQVTLSLLVTVGSQYILTHALNHYIFSRLVDSESISLDVQRTSFTRRTNLHRKGLTSCMLFALPWLYAL